MEYGMQVHLRGSLVDVGLIHTMRVIIELSFDSVPPSNSSHNDSNYILPSVLPDGILFSDCFIFTESYDNKPTPYLDGLRFINTYGIDCSLNYKAFIVKYK